MAILNFPPATGSEAGKTYEANGVLYTWDGYKWEANSESAFDDKYVNIDGDTMTGDLTVPSLNDGPLGGFRNQLINGDFRVWQRGTDFTLAGQTFTADRWLLNSSSGKNTERRELSQPCQFRYALKTGVPATNKGSIIQPIELPGNGSPGPFINGSIWTFSFYSNQDFSAVAPIFKFSETAAATANTVSVTGVPTFTDSGESLESNSNYKRWTCTFTVNVVPLVSNICLNVQIPHASFGTVNINYAGFQLEPGPVATPFEHRPIQTELALCQRYYYEPARNATQCPYLAPYKDDFLQRQYTEVYPTTMRRVPTVTVNATSITGAVAAYPSVNSTYIEAAVSNAQLPNGSRVINLTFDAEL